MASSWPADSRPNDESQACCSLKRRCSAPFLPPCLATAIAVAIAAPALIEGQGQADDGALRAQAQAALRKAVEFYRTKVANEGAYHFAYAEDLSYGRSEERRTAAR